MSSAKLKFAEAQAKKSALKSQQEVEKMEADKRRDEEKTIRDAKFEKEKKKVMKERAAETALLDEFTERLKHMTTDEKVKLMADLRAELAGFHRDMKKMHADIHCHAVLVGREAARYSAVNTMIGALSRFV